MLSLTYFSTSASDLDRDDLLALLHHARSRNASVGVTGMLLYADRSFVQTLEGPDDVVDDTFRRISGDPRHRAVSVALREQVSDRTFADWSMGFREIGPDEARLVPGFSDYLGGTESTRRPGAARAEVFHRAFRSFAP